MAGGAPALRLPLVPRRALRLALQDALSPELLLHAALALDPAQACRLACACPRLAGVLLPPLGARQGSGEGRGAAAASEFLWRELALAQLRRLGLGGERLVDMLNTGRLLDSLRGQAGTGGLRGAGGAGAEAEGARPGSAATSPGATWPRLCAALALARRGLVIDFGFGYTKFGSAQPRGDSDGAPASLRLCSSPSRRADAPREAQIQEVFNRSLEASAADGTVFVSEPFDLPSDSAAEAWRRDFVQPQLPEGVTCVFLPQPLLALLAHGIVDDGIVVNIGHRETTAVPCLGGRILRDAASSNPRLGSALLTKLMLVLVGRRQGVDLGSGPDDEWDLLMECRELKERHCCVALEAPLRGRPLSPDAVEDVGPQDQAPVEVPFAGATALLGSERYLVPEALFWPLSGSLPQLVLEAAARAAAAAGPCEDRDAVWSRLLGSVVVVGGAAELPGLRARLAKELRERVAQRGFQESRQLSRAPCVEVRVPLEELACSPKSAVLRGGQLAAVAAMAAGDPAGMLPLADSALEAAQEDVTAPVSEVPKQVFAKPRTT
ncbi:unnamed protein product [Prorocentrum cordatum]|uniref:Actin-related protein 8 n=1 Tax=Prorocentrum cordatum TaxID=2364126 RepID=A0ABN9RR17_9DINO|nr:unnamed protein product [Polarella glacialis]